MEASLNALASAFLLDYVPFHSTALKMACTTMSAYLVSTLLKSDWLNKCVRPMNAVRVGDAQLIRKIEDYARQSVKEFAWSKNDLRPLFTTECKLCFEGHSYWVKAEKGDLVVRSKHDVKRFLHHFMPNIPYVLCVEQPEKPSDYGYGRKQDRKDVVHEMFYLSLKSYLTRNCKQAQMTFDGSRYVASEDSMQFTETFEQKEVEVILERGCIELRSMALDLDALHRYAQHVVQKQRKLDYESGSSSTLTMYVHEHGEWVKTTSTTSKTLANVCVAHCVREAFVDGITEFLRAEPQYVKRGQVFKRGYCLHGPPGTFKSSVIKAIAVHHALPIFMCNLNRLNSESFHALARSSLKLANGAPHLFVLEEVDRSKLLSGEPAVVSTKSSDQPVSMQDLLEAIDGVMEARGRITVLTGNNSTLLTSPPDEALFRPGRIDAVIRMDYIAPEQVQQLVALFFPGLKCEVKATFKNLSPAQFVSFLTVCDASTVRKVLRGTCSHPLLK